MPLLTKISGVTRWKIKASITPELYPPSDIRLAHEQVGLAWHSKTEASEDCALRVASIRLAAASKNGASCGLGRRTELFLGVPLPKHRSAEETHATLKTLMAGVGAKNTLAIAALPGLVATRPNTYN